jgi:hypothetical protein
MAPCLQYVLYILLKCTFQYIGCEYSRLIQITQIMFRSTAGNSVGRMALSHQLFKGRESPPCLLPAPHVIRHPPPRGLFLPATPSLRATRGPAPTRPQAASPIFRAALVQTSADAPPFHSASLYCKGGDTPQLAVASPRLRQVAFGIWFQMPRTSAKTKEEHT